MKALISMLLAAVSAYGLCADAVYYVDGTNGCDDYDGLAAKWDGTHGPKRVIQDAVDLFGAGGVGTIKVLPGVYGDDQGYALATNKNASTPVYWGDGTVRCRVFVADKRLRIESTEGAERTHIVGKWSSSSSGLGADAVRCVGVGCGPGSVGTVIKGFTLRDGATPSSASTEEPVGNGGAVGTDRGNLQVYVVDCVASNCVASGGGAFYRVTAIRSKVVCNRAATITRGPAAFKSRLYASAVLNNGKATDSQCEALLDCPSVLNCAVFANNGGDLRANESGLQCEVVNSLFLLPRLDYATRINGQATSLAVRSCAFNIESGHEVICNSGSVTTEGLVNVSANPYVVVSPWEGDFRQVKDSATDGSGVVQETRPDWIPAEFWGVGLDGKPLVVDGKTPIGPVATSVAMSGGFLTFAADAGELLPNVADLALMLDSPVNSTVNNRYFIGSDTWPRQVRAVARTDVAGAQALYFRQGGVPGVSSAPHRWCGRDNSAALTFPPAGVAFVNTPVWATNVVYCAPNGLDANDGLTDQTPKTINGACASATDRTLVIALPGTYEGDPVTVRSCATRVSVPVASTLLRSRDGAATTIVKGVYATDGQGRPTSGDSAVRCLCLGDSTCAQGFTLAGGGVVRNENSDFGSGGGVLGQSSRSVLMDSVITNCYGSRGVCRYAWSVRCRYVGNWAQDQGIVREGNVSSCEFFSNTVPLNYSITTSGAAYGCSFYETNYGGGSGMIVGGNGQMSAYNCVVGGSSQCYNSNVSGREYVGCFSLGAVSATGVTVSSALFAAAAKGDLRLRSDSPAVGGGDSEATLPSTKDGGSNAKADWARFTTDDIEGKLVQFKDGKPTAGARQRAAQVVNVRVVTADEVAPSGECVMDETDRIEVAVAESPRQYLGYEIDGIFTPTDVRRFTVTAPAFPDGVLVARAVFNTNWYVNAAAGYSDDNDGWTPETARQSLAEGVRDAVPGDVVHVAKGVYDRKKALHSGARNPSRPDPQILSRVVVPAGVTLRGEDGPDGVIIVGERASADCGDYDGTLGTGCNAVRCVFLETGAKLERVTCANGHSGSSGSTITGGEIADDDNFGGGVLGRYSGLEVVSHCIITNCGGGRAGAAAWVRVANSYVADNVGATGAAGRGASFFGCVLRNNAGPSPLIETGFLIDSTFIGAAASSPAIGSVDFIANSVIDCKRDMYFGDARVVISNSVVCSDYEIVNGNVVSNGLVRISSEAMMLDARGVPEKGSPLVDWASGRVETRYDLYADRTDSFDVPRVLNDGRQDLGGAEHDWRVDYGRDLCAGKVVVTEVSSMAKELLDGRVSIPVGEMTLDWSADKSRSVVAHVTGNGTLALYRDGGMEPVHTWVNGTLRSIATGAWSRSTPG